MGVKNVKLGANLTFDDVKEKELVLKVEYLLSRHKLGEFISHLIRIALESPEKMKSHAELDGMLKELYESGVSKERAEYFKSLNDEVVKMQEKVDAVYKMAEMNYTMALMGKKLALEEKAENSLRAQFVLQRQISQLNEVLGESLYGAYESNKIADVKTKSDEVLQYIIESYDGILSEIKESNTVSEVKDAEVKKVKEKKIEEKKIEKKIEEKVEDEVYEDDEIISFEGADVDALTGFFGGE